MPNIRLRPQAPTEHADEKLHRRLIAVRANAGLPDDATSPMKAPLPLKEYTVATLPTASIYRQSGQFAGLVAVSDETGGYTLAFTDGTNWRRVQDRAIVS